MSEITVRALTEDEWETYRTLRLEALRESPDAFVADYDTEAAEPEDFWRARMGRSDRLVAEADGEQVGVVVPAVLHQRDALGPKYAELVYNGFWFAPEREALQVYFDHVAKSVTGTARLKLYKGNCIVAGRKAERSLYDKDLVSFEAGGDYNQHDAGAFIKLNSLRMRVQKRVEDKGKK